MLSNRKLVSTIVAAAATAHLCQLKRFCFRFHLSAVTVTVTATNIIAATPQAIATIATVNALFSHPKGIPIIIL